MPALSMDQLVSLSKRRGFFFAGSEIYGGMQGTFDYGPLGVELKQNLVNDWWRTNVYLRDDIEGLDAAVLMNRLAWRYSGHEETFSDPLVDCRSCNMRWRADHISGSCPSCGSRDLTEPRPFNMMFKTAVGAVADADSYAYLRPETAQGIFVNFLNVQSSTSRKLPFGIAQVGKAFRNEINPRNFLFRVREFDQMEIEFFVMPGSDEHWHQHWLDARLNWWQQVGVPRNRITIYDVPSDELAHYSKRTYDLMYDYPSIGVQEIEGIANRTDFDLGSHSKDQAQLGLTAKVKANSDSTARLTYFDQASNRHVVPYVIEPSAGIGRALLAILSEAYAEERTKAVPTETVQSVADVLQSFVKSVGRNDRLPAEQRSALHDRAATIAADLADRLPEIDLLLAMPGADQIEVGKKLRGVSRPAVDEHFRTVLHLKPHLAPVKVAVFPLKRNQDQIVATAQAVRRQLQLETGARTVYDDTGAIGKLYRRQDEIGTPFCVTVDFDTIGAGQDGTLSGTVTVRERDSMAQERVPIAELSTYISERLRP